MNHLAQRFIVFTIAYVGLFHPVEAVTADTIDVWSVKDKAIHVSTEAIANPLRDRDAGATAIFVELLEKKLFSVECEEKFLETAFTHTDPRPPRFLDTTKTFVLFSKNSGTYYECWIELSSKDKIRMMEATLIDGHTVIRSGRVSEVRDATLLSLLLRALAQ